MQKETEGAVGHPGPWYHKWGGWLKMAYIPHRSRGQKSKSLHRVLAQGPGYASVLPSPMFLPNGPPKMTGPWAKVPLRNPFPMSDSLVSGVPGCFWVLWDKRMMKSPKKLSGCREHQSKPRETAALQNCLGDQGKQRSGVTLVVHDL